jgi:drug/metabolite transporter (DMT)-like permease
MVESIVILLSVGCSATAHLLMKIGMVQVMDGQPGTALLHLALRTSFNPWVVGGMFLHVAALGLWLAALAKVEVSYAYPFISLGFVIVAAASYFLLGEQLTWLRIAGMAVIATGVILVSQS